MLLKKTIKVTAEDIKKGERETANYCPVALALRRELKISKQEDINILSVHWDELEIPSKIGVLTFKADPKIDKFIEKFDEGKKVRPFSFVLEI